MILIFDFPPHSLALLPLLLHLLLLTPSSHPLCLSSQQGGEARLTNWTKSEWIAEGQRRAWVGAMPVGRCSQQHNARWRRLSSGVHPSRAKVTGLIRSEVNRTTCLIEEGVQEKERWGRRSSPVWKAQRGGMFLPPLYLTRLADSSRWESQHTHNTLSWRKGGWSETHAGPTQ